MNFHDLSPEKQIAEIASRVRSAIGLVNEDEAAAVIGVEPSTLATWRSQGKGPEYVKLGKGVFYTVNDMSKWVNDEMTRQIAVRKAA